MRSPRKARDRKARGPRKKQEKACGWVCAVLKHGFGTLPQDVSRTQRPRKVKRIGPWALHTLAEALHAGWIGPPGDGDAAWWQRRQDWPPFALLRQVRLVKLRNFPASWVEDRERSQCRKLLPLNCQEDVLPFLPEKLARLPRALQEGCPESFNDRQQGVPPKRDPNIMLSKETPSRKRARQS